MEKQPTLATNRLLLRPFTLDDVAGYQHLARLQADLGAVVAWANAQPAR